MAGFRRWYRRRYPTLYRRYRRRYRRYRRRYVNGSSRSSIRLKVPIHDVDAFTQNANDVGTTVAAICPWTNSIARTSALNSPLYRNYCNLYDEVKCIGMKIKINVSSQVGGSDIPSLQIFTAFDRRYGHTDSAPNYQALKTYATYQVATAVNNSVAKLERSIYASDLLEKAQWHDCSLSLTGAYYDDDAYKDSGSNPNFFVPSLFLCFAIPQTTAQTVVRCTYDIMYYFAFRNPKYGGSSSPSKLDVETLSYSTRSIDPSLGDGEALMDDDGDDVDEEPPPAAVPAADSAPAPRRVRHAIPPIVVGPLSARSSRKNV